MRFLRALALAIAALGAVGWAPQDRLNVVVIMADDLDLGLLKGAVDRGHMPHFKRLFADQGLTFANSFATNAICGPSRATFLTGQYSKNHGVRHNGLGLKALDSTNTLPVWLQRAGYRTAHVGKYINGYGYQVPGTWVPPGWDAWHGLVDPSTYRVHNYWISDNGRLSFHGERPEDYQTDVLARRAVGFVQAVDGPFFLHVAPMPPHVEIDASSEWTWEAAFSWTVRPAPRHLGSTAGVPLPRPPSFDEPDVRDKPAWLQAKPRLSSGMISGLAKQYRDRAASLRAVDDLIGAVAGALQARGLLEKTVLVFTADNGFHHGEHRLVEKVFPYEESIRVPLLMRVPGAAPRAVTEMVLNTDLAPTIAEIAGAVPTLAVDGRSLLPLTAGTPAAWRKRGMIEHWMATPTLSELEVPVYAAVRTADDAPSLPRRTYVEYRQGGWGGREYYDMNLDPHQVLSLHEASWTAPARAALALWLDLLRLAPPGGIRAFED